MSDTRLFDAPTISDEDIHWATSLLGLPTDAFHGDDGNDPRQDVLKSLEPMDIAACPGSGKTTLLVAKLAILAKGWSQRTQGICVLSHTNAARHEIETRLGNTNVGRRLLSYPHFIGTIHGFVNEFLALPWLRSKDYQITLIDTEICEVRRWNKLDQNYRGPLETQRHMGPSSIFIRDVDFNLAKKVGSLPFKEDSQTYKRLRNACRETAKEGYHCYDDMFLWAQDLIDSVPDAVKVIRDRFPLFFVDEAQDNSEAQSKILHRIFIDGSSPVIRQRFGDGNQAIYGFVEAKESRTDRFPYDPIKTDLPNSHRFGQDIADLVDPLGLTPYGLKGHGPRRIGSSSTKTKSDHTVFLFGDNNAHKVLDAYGELLIKSFSDQELREGTFAAVGLVHKPGDKDDQEPRHVGHYWSGYDPELSRKEPRPQTFARYVLAGLGKSRTTGEASWAVEKIAEGLLRLASIAKDFTTRPRSRHNHRLVLKLLQTQSHIRESYMDLVSRFVLNPEEFTREKWDDRFKSGVLNIAYHMTEKLLKDSDAISFLDWNDERTGLDPSVASQGNRDNVFSFSKNGKKVAIRIGSVHSVKGENHTATLVLETFWHDHNLDSIKEWLCGERKGHTGKEVRIPTRLKIHYVAMTRPSHLLCLAMKRTSLENGRGELKQDLLDRFRQHGWQLEWI